MKYIVFLILIFNSNLLNASNVQSPTGGFFDFRASLSEGSTIYQNVGSKITGAAGEVVLGFRPAEFLKMGCEGIFESVILTSGSSNIGRINMIGYGGNLRLFFLPKVFMEGGGGGTQANLEIASTKANLIADGTFYYIGPGVEFNIGSWFSLDLGVRTRTIIFPKKEFDTMTSIFYSFGFNLYF